MNIDIKSYGTGLVFPLCRYVHTSALQRTYNDNTPFLCHVYVVIIIIIIIIIIIMIIIHNNNNNNNN